MEVLLHPAYFPNCITMATVLQCDVIWEVFDNFQKQTYRNRCYIATDQGRLMLTIPIRHTGDSSGRQHYREVRTDDGHRWQRQHWRSLETAYRAAPFFEYYEADLRPLFETEYPCLLDLNLATTAALCSLLGHPFPESRTRSFREDPQDVFDARDLIRAKAPDPMELPPYPQAFQERHGFLPNLSTLDLLFNEGPAAREYLGRIPLPWNA